jgi:hypothetical protein
MEGTPMHSRFTVATARAAAILLAVAPAAVAIEKQDPADVQMFTQAMCIVSISDAKVVSLMDPDTEDPNAAAQVSFKSLPDAKAGDLVKLTPSTSGDPEVKVVTAGAEPCKRFLKK